MPIRSYVYRVFMKHYPDAQFVTVYHENGRFSEIASGKCGGRVELVFVGTYEVDGSQVIESCIRENGDLLPEVVCSEGPMHYYQMGAELAMDHAKSPICSKP